MQVRQLGLLLDLPALTEAAEEACVAADWSGDGGRDLRELLQGQTPEAVKRLLHHPRRSAVCELEVGTWLQVGCLVSRTARSLHAQLKNLQCMQAKMLPKARWPAASADGASGCRHRDAGVYHFVHAARGSARPEA